MELHHSAETEAPKKVTKLFLNRPLGPLLCLQRSLWSRLRWVCPPEVRVHEPGWTSGYGSGSGRPNGSMAGCGRVTLRGFSAAIRVARLGSRIPRTLCRVLARTRQCALGRYFRGDPLSA